MSKRFFAFGCSFTNYRWATWADVIGSSLRRQGYEYYNYGNSGAGNYYMYSSLMAADQRHSFTDDDIIMVMWSSWNREDRFILNYDGWDPEYNLRGQGTKEGNILSAVNFSMNFDPSFLRYWSLEDDIAKNILSISHARKLYNITYEHTIPAFEEPKDFIRPDADDPAERIFQKFINMCNNKKDLWDEGYRDTSIYPMGSIVNAIKNEDGHPTPMHHLHYVKNHIQTSLPHLRLYDDTAVKMCENLEKKMIDAKHRNLKGWGDDIAKIWNKEQKEILDGDYRTLWADDMFEILMDNFKF